jgi:hypothetical protein
VTVAVRGGRRRNPRRRRQPASILPALGRDAVVVGPQAVLAGMGEVAPVNGVVEMNDATQSRHVPRPPMSRPPGREPGLPGRHSRGQEPFWRLGDRTMLPAERRVCLPVATRQWTPSSAGAGSLWDRTVTGHAKAPDCYTKRGADASFLATDVIVGGQNGLLAFLAVGAALLLWPKLRTASLPPS